MEDLAPRVAIGEDPEQEQGEEQPREAVAPAQEEGQAGGEGQRDQRAHEWCRQGVREQVDDSHGLEARVAEVGDAGQRDATDREVGQGEAADEDAQQRSRSAGGGGEPVGVGAAQGAVDHAGTSQVAWTTRSRGWVWPSK